MNTVIFGPRWRRLGRPRIRIVLVATMLFAAAIVSNRSQARAASAEIGFSVRCPMSHELADDPLVHPGEPGASHMHQFFGNTATDAFATFKSLRQADTTCELSADRASYWAPSLVLSTGEVVEPSNMNAYYRAPPGHTPSSIQPYPKGLAMIAGNGLAPGPQSTQVVYYTCSPSGTAPIVALPIDCSPWPGTYLVAHIRFPSCWDGKNLWTPDRSHMAYVDPVLGCPATHPVEVPRLGMSIRWKSVVNGAGAGLTSGPAYTLHADFWNVWEPTALAGLVTDCIRELIDCGFQQDPA
jgi:hypothetical protein